MKNKLFLFPIMSIFLTGCFSSHGNPIDINQALDRLNQITSSQDAIIDNTKQFTYHNNVTYTDYLKKTEEIYKIVTSFDVENKYYYQLTEYEYYEDSKITNKVTVENYYYLKDGYIYFAYIIDDGNEILKNYIKYDPAKVDFDEQLPVCIDPLPTKDDLKGGMYSQVLEPILTDSELPSYINDLTLSSRGEGHLYFKLIFNDENVNDNKTTKETVLYEIEYNDNILGSAKTNLESKVISDNTTIEHLNTLHKQLIYTSCSLDYPDLSDFHDIS